MKSNESDNALIDARLLARLACPRCKSPLQLDRQREVLACESCRLRYPIRDGIPIMLPDEAEQY
jgi:uncharacterized protein YbaR (Trm112 family)